MSLEISLNNEFDLIIFKYFSEIIKSHPFVTIVTEFIYITKYNQYIRKHKGGILMIEKLFEYGDGEDKKIEKIINDENLHLNHMIFPKGEGLPQHNANSNVYMIVIRGILSLQLDDQDEHKYDKGSIANIPYKTLMNVNNKDDETLEIFVIKAPNPKDMD